MSIVAVIVDGFFFFFFIGIQAFKRVFMRNFMLEKCRMNRKQYSIQVPFLIALNENFETFLTMRLFGRDSECVIGLFAYRLSKQSGNKLKFLFKINRLLDSKLFSFFFIYVCKCLSS